jgi:hypothetical protein
LNEGSPLPKKRLLHEIANDEWSCRFCTFSNEAKRNECLCCETPKKAIVPKWTSPAFTRSDSGTYANPITISIDDGIEHVSGSASNSQQSPQDEILSFSSESEFADALKGAVVQCEVCSCEFSVDDMESLKEHAALHLSGSSAHFTVTRETLPSQASSNNRNDNLQFSTVYEAQYARCYRRAFAKHKSSIQINDHLKRMSNSLMLEPDIETMKDGIIGALVEYYQKIPQNNRNFVLATKVSHFWCGFGDGGWGCGYRNIQTLCSSLMEMPHYRDVLFGGIGYVPSILVLQQSLEAAWTEGFDPHSKAKLTGVYGGNQWIGTYDAVSMLRHFGVPMELITFTAKRRVSNEGRGSGNSLIAPKASFSTSSSNNVATSAFKYRRYQPALFVPHTNMFKWVWSHFESCKSRGDKFIMPLYLQHDGHSRTIIGAENVNGRIALLLLDPSFSSANLINQLRSANSVPEVIRKTLSEFRHENYQIAYCRDPAYVIPPERRSSWKTIHQQPLVRS